jgi:alcohol dehydrogenase
VIPAYYEFANTAKVLSGEGAINNIPFELKNLKCSRALVLTNAQLRGLGLVDIVLSALGDGGIEVGVLYDDVPVDSSVTVVTDVAKVFTEFSCDCIVAVGGGSVLDTAKGANILLSSGAKDLMRLRGVDRLVGRFMVPFVAVPTTAGTGSEVTGAAVIKDTERHVKMGFASFNLVPDVAVLDPRLTVGLPQRLTGSTGMDALVHAVEAFSCKQANPLSDAYARTAIDLVREYLPVAINEGRDVTSWPASRSATRWSASCMPWATHAAASPGCPMATRWRSCSRTVWRTTWTSPVRATVSCSCISRARTSTRARPGPSARRRRSTPSGHCWTGCTSAPASR